MQVQLSPQRQHHPQLPPLSPMDSSSSSATTSTSTTGLRRYVPPASPTNPTSPSRPSTAPSHRANDPANADNSSNATSSTSAAAQARPAAARGEKEASGNYPDYMPNPMFASFTKSRNWAQKLVDEVADLICVLTPQGNIVFASSSSRSLVGFGSDEMVHRHISEFIHPDDARHMALAVSTAARTGQPYHLIHRYRRKNADYVILEIHGRTMPPLSTYRSTLGLASATATGAAGQLRDPTLIVSVGREYPGKLSPFLDSVLDLKIEHERLEVRKSEVEASVARNAALKRKQLMQLHSHPLPVAGAGSSTSESTSGYSAAATTSQSPMSPGSSGAASDQSGRERSGSLSIDDSTSSSGGGGSNMPSSRPMPSIPDMPVGQTPSTVGIFGPAGGAAGNSSAGGTTANSQAAGGSGGNLGWYDTSPGAAEIMRNVPQAAKVAPVAVPSSSRLHAETSASGSALAADSAGGGATEAAVTGEAAGEARKKRKKRVVTEIMDRVCISCGSTSSPEWRKGPTGAKTLCNACGLRYAKKVKTEAQALAQQQGGEGAAGDAAQE
ncbi:hypothetical protein BCR44DRAFT_49868 [Catenaria anguillulae PL171]|uniref:GATA-type domain-containing protein n=1 Tax=Catenaria anguillulae PL171 TaxID=765915 RepID=A0A1Y2HP59_9FUNG|nr:hypothetical protein BCR44DRAFT_49868 [Catenaria anguillulae PL171]